MNIGTPSIKKWNAELRVPTDSNYQARIVGIEFTTAKSSDNPMVVIDFEFTQPTEVEILGGLYNIAGVKAQKRYYTITKTENGNRVAAQGREALQFLFDQVGYTDPVDWENPPISVLKGKNWLVGQEAEEKIKRKTPTLAQVEEAKAKGVSPMGDPQKHPVTGKPLVQYWPSVTDVFAVAPDGHIEMAGV